VGPKPNPPVYYLGAMKLYVTARAEKRPGFFHSEGKGQVVVDKVRTPANLHIQGENEPTSHRSPGKRCLGTWFVPGYAAIQRRW